MKLLKFEAVWCAPCKRQNEEFRDNPVKISVRNIDIDEEEELQTKYDVGSIPKMILLDDDDSIIKEWVGFTESKEINDFIDGRQATAD